MNSYDNIIGANLEDKLENGFILKEFNNINFEDKTENEKFIKMILFLENLYKEDKSLNFLYYYDLKNKDMYKKSIEKSLKIGIKKFFPNNFNEMFNKYKKIINDFQLYIKSSYDLKNSKFIKDELELITRMKNIINNLDTNVINNLNKEVEENFKLLRRKLKEEEEEKKKVKKLENIQKNIGEDKGLKKVFDILKIVSKTSSEIKKYDIEHREKQELSFNITSFGDLTSKQLDNMEKINISEYTEGFHSTRRQNNVIDEVINFSMLNQINHQDFSNSNEKYINFYSNLFYNVIFPKLKNLNIKDQEVLLQDIQKIVFMMTNIHKSLVSIFGGKEIINKECIDIYKKINKKIFTKSILLNEKEMEKLKNGFFKNDLLDDFFKNVTSGNKINNIIQSDIIDNSTVDKLLFKTENTRSEIDKKYHTIKKEIKKEMIDEVNQYKEKSIKEQPIINIYKIFINLIIEYSQHIENNNYIRPIILFNQNLESITKFIEGLEYSIENANLYDFLLTNSNFYSDSNTNTIKYLSKLKEDDLKIIQDKIMNENHEMNKEYYKSDPFVVEDWRKKEKMKEKMKEKIKEENKEKESISSNMEDEYDFF